ncbi:MAG: transporter substrate-binding domain-containing protein, partial [Desulfobulbaceae bacterium]|nr:transporter substrate-binding domain-containing protein [Desulfobulbaceae bacterium]
GFFFEEVLRKSYPQINRLPVKGTLESLKAVSFGKADAAVGASAVFNHFIREHLLTNLTVSGELDVGNPDLVNLRIGIRNDWQIFQGIIIKAMAAISSEDKIKLQQKWLLRENKIKEDHGELTEKQKSWLAEHQKLRLGFAAGWAPFEFYNKNEVFSGMTSDFIRILNKRLGVEMIPQQGLTWAEMLDKAKNGEIDVISTIVPTEKRREYLNFTKPYLSLPLMVVRRDDAPYISGIGDLKGKVIAVVKGYVTEDYIKQDFPDQKLLALDSTAEVLRAVSEGRADALLENMATVEFEQKRLDINNLKVAASTPYTFQLSYGVRKDWPELVVVLDKALAAFSDQEKGLMLDKWTNVQIEERANWKLVWQIILLGVFVSGCILLVIIIWNRRLAGEVAERKLAEQELLRLKNVAESANSQLQQEIDARKTVTEKLSIEKIFSETLINSLPGIFYLINENGRQIRRNKNHETVTGYSDEEFINLNVLEMFPENQRKLIEKTMSEVLLKEDANVEVKILTKSGAKIPHFFTIRKMTIDNKHFIIGTGSDISELKKIEAELRRKMKELEKFSKMAFGREQMMISLKEEINQLRIELGKEEKYKIVER